jgi:DNA modification methylase
MADIKLLQGDCLELLKDIPDKSIDLILTDPPYVCENHGGGTAELAQRDLVKNLHIDFMSNGFAYD